MSPEIKIVNLEITTHCNQRCENCSVGIGINRALVHHDWDYLKKAAQALYGIHEVKLLGGEPTVHPNFRDIVPQIKTIFGCQRLSMDTNGWGYERYRELIDSYFDQVNFSDYHNLSPAVLLSLKSNRLVSIFDAGVNASNFTPRSRRGSGKPCNRAWYQSGMISYADGKIYSCCVAPGIEGSVGIRPVYGWWKNLPPMPCQDCFFSE